MTDKTIMAMKATPLDDDAFRLLALPFGGPIPYPGAPRGVDIDRQWFEEGTDFGAMPKRVPVTWHHGADPYGVMGKAVLAEAMDPELEEDGWWVKVWMRHGEKRVNLVRRLAEKGAQLFGSSEAVDGSGQVRTSKGALVPWNRSVPGAITRWHYNGQTLSTSPQNTLSVLRPIKATLDELSKGSLEPTDAFFSDLAAFMDNLGTPAADPTGEAAAKAGRVLAARNEARLREALTALSDVLTELDKYVAEEAAGT